MAIIRTGTVVGAISGNLGGVCFVAGRGTPIIRQRIHKKNSQTAKQVAQRSAAQYIGHWWPQLTVLTRKKWEIAATKFPVTNRLGQTSQSSAYSLWFRCAMGTYLWNRSIFFPTPTGPETIAPRTLTFVVSAAGTIRITFAPAIFVTYLASIFAARPFSVVVPKHFANLKHMITSTGDVANFIDFTAEFDGAFGHPDIGEAVLATISLFSPGFPPQEPTAISTITIA